MEYGFGRRKVYLLGCTEVAKNVIAQTYTLVDIAGILDMTLPCVKSSFCGYSVTPYCAFVPSADSLIVDCSAPHYEPSFAEEQMQQDGLSPFQEYVDYVTFLTSVISKPILIVSGFCHTDDIYRAIIKIPAFADAYHIYNFSYDIKNMTKYSSRILNRLVSRCSVYIYNQNENSLLSFTDKELPRECIQICVPLVRFYGIWPQINRNHLAYDNIYYFAPAGYYDGAFIGGDTVINRGIDAGISWEEIYSDISSKNYYSTDHIMKNLETSFRQMTYSEKNADLLIVDFIRDNYKKMRLFKDYRHIDNPVVVEYVRQIARILKIRIEEESFDCLLYEDIHEYTEMPVYPCVAECLGLQWITSETKYCVRAYSGTRYVTFQEYVEWYYHYSKAVKLLKEIW